MRRNNGERKPRRERLRASLRRESGGGFSTHAARMMAQPLGGVPVQCTLIGRCRTFVFAFPRSKLLADDASTQCIVWDEDGMRVAIVDDIQRYFEGKEAKSLHYEICVSFREAIRGVHEKSTKERDESGRKLLLVIDEYEEFSPVSMTKDQCFLIDEVRDGEQIIVGGRSGKKALLAFPALGCPWPEVASDMYRVNVILAAVKSVQNATGHIAQIDESSCFVSSHQEAVYTLSMSMSANAEAVSRLTTKELQERTGRIKNMVRDMMAETDPAASELIDSIILDESTDDGYLRLSYLRLWQAVEDARRHLGHPGLLNERDVIAGGRAPAELKSYRNEIAHWRTGRIDHSYLSDLQFMTMELLRRKYGGSA